MIFVSDGDIFPTTFLAVKTNLSKLSSTFFVNPENQTKLKLPRGTFMMELAK